MDDRDELIKAEYGTPATFLVWYEEWLDGCLGPQVAHNK
jgi:hypothetical protein